MMDLLEGAHARLDVPINPSPDPAAWLLLGGFEALFVHSDIEAPFPGAGANRVARAAAVRAKEVVMIPATLVRPDT